MMRNGWMAPAMLVVLASGVPVARAALDRAGEPRATLILTHRELFLAYDHDRDENSGVAVNWSWARAPQLDSMSLAEVAALGFDCEGARYQCGSNGGRRAWIVVGIDPSMWDREIATVQREIDSVRTAAIPDSVAGLALRQRVERLRQLVLRTSRLEMVEVGRDPEALARRWNDGQHLVLPARLRVYRDGWPADTLPGRTPTFRVNAEPLPASLYVPIRFAPPLRDTLGTREQFFEVTVVVGRRWLPRVEEVRKVAAPEWSAETP